jgi:hypothetical protein
MTFEGIVLLESVLNDIKGLVSQLVTEGEKFKVKPLVHFRCVYSENETPNICLTL